MVFSKDTLKKIFKKEYKEEDFTPNGIDLRLKDVEYCVDNQSIVYGFNENGEKILPETLSLRKVDGFYYFEPGIRYLWNLGVNKYPNCIGTFYLRSTIMRAGGRLYSSVADFGYDGTIIVGFETANRIKIPANERVVQCIFSELDSIKGDQYNGDYQHDKIYKE